MNHKFRFGIVFVILLTMLMLGMTASLLAAYPLTPQANSISGLVTYTGSIGGTHEIIVAAHPAIDGPPVESDHVFSGDTYTLVGGDLVDGNYYISAFLDVNDSGGGPPDDGEPLAYYDGNHDGTPDAVTMSGSAVSGIDIALTDGDTNTNGIVGQVDYVGTAVPSNTSIYISAHTSLDALPEYSTHVVGPSNTYTLPVTNGTYYVIAFLDANGTGGGPPDYNELRTFYDENEDRIADPVTVSSNMITGVDITLYDNFVQGTAVYGGAIPGEHTIEVGLHPVVNQEPSNYTQLTTPGGPYSVTAFPGNYYVSAFVDFDNSGGAPGEHEPTIYYDANGDGTPDTITISETINTIDFELGGILYVDASATGANNGASWANAFSELTDALATAQSQNEIWVAAGTYTPGNTRESTFTMQNGVAIYGGFSGTETWRYQRDFTQNQTILSGNIGNTGAKTDNVYHVVTTSNTDKTAVLDGVIITGGYANTDQPHDKGGGIYNDFGSPTLANLRFLDNYAVNHGGGMVNQYPGAEPQLTNCQFSGNSTQSNGGAIANLGGGSAILTNSSITGNNGGNGGGIVNLQQGHAQVDNTIIWGNGGAEIGLQSQATISVSYSIVEGGYVGTGNLDSNPMFLDADGADNLFGTPDDDLHLQANSPAIDAGNNALLSADDGDTNGDNDFAEPFPWDIDLQARQIDDPATSDTGMGSPPLVDIGADEFSLSPITGLQANNSSPTKLGTTTQFTATITGGSGITYAWDFGDGGTDSGAMVSHTYSQPGVYTAVLTATNDAGSESATTTVTIYEALTITPGGSQTTGDGVVEIEAGTGTAVAEIAYTPLESPTNSTGAFGLAGTYFQLTAVDDQGTPISGALTSPLTITITYDEAALPPTIPESSLQLYRFDEDTTNWIPLTIISRSPLANQIVVLLDHLSEFALLSDNGGKSFIYLPMITAKNGN